eukprot:3813170-Pyramimonas_sp.AAC.1
MDRPLLVNARSPKPWASHHGPATIRRRLMFETMGRPLLEDTCCISSDSFRNSSGISSDSSGSSLEPCWGDGLCLVCAVSGLCRAALPCLVRAVSGLYMADLPRRSRPLSGLCREGPRTIQDLVGPKPYGVLTSNVQRINIPTFAYLPLLLKHGTRALKKSEV